MCAANILLPCRACMPAMGQIFGKNAHVLARIGISTIQPPPYLQVPQPPPHHRPALARGRAHAGDVPEHGRGVHWPHLLGVQSGLFPSALPAGHPSPRQMFALSAVQNLSVNCPLPTPSAARTLTSLPRVIHAGLSRPAVTAVLPRIHTMMTDAVLLLRDRVDGEVVCLHY